MSAPGTRSRLALLRAGHSTSSRRRRAQARDNAQRRRLAAARRTQQRNELAGPHVEIKPIERTHAVGKIFFDATQRDDCGGALRKTGRRRGMPIGAPVKSRADHLRLSTLQRIARTTNSTAASVLSRLSFVSDRQVWKLTARPSAASRVRPDGNPAQARFAKRLCADPSATGQCRA